MQPPLRDVERRRQMFNDARSTDSPPALTIVGQLVLLSSKVW